MEKTNLIRFSNSNRLFYNELKKRVDLYFKEHKLEKNGNWNMYLKTIFMFSAYLVPYFLIAAGVFESKVAWFLLSLLMGLGMAGIGLCVMHDANHGSYSKNVKINKLLGYLSMNIVGGYSLNWRIQHNVIHHTYTNIHNEDEDIAPVGILRFEPHAEKKWIHRFQFLYAWIFYGFMTLMWSTTKDFNQLARYNRKGLLKTANVNYGTELRYLIASKLLYYAFVLLPYFLVKEMSFLNWLVGYLVIHFTASLCLTLIFQSAHVVEETEFPLPDSNGNVENHWAEHQLRTTMNFANGNPVLTWLVGGLNHQVEHHLFPNICHIHYPKISKIVEQTAHEFSLPYKKTRTFIGAIISHEHMLWKLGRV
ncbi:MAG TPA: acyl-CoA desaturase [Bacteroidia bacterium]|nr:acyl-CoA desaturase [Bacteroidia bacterium]